ncbi:uncharacterized protein LOC103575171 [Microplitis demolitor]|uniref:uncharacterized protein LOC103575171 n=1 Tax=Microplitis demolitor TaxID=69319 RepID=UPI0004CD1466|nr:uncharacterized protein LOC103575171 [Microplitis demolitor]
MINRTTSNRVFLKMFNKILLIALIASLYLYFEIDADSIDDKLQAQRLKLSQICTDAGFKFACVLDRTCVPSCAYYEVDAEKNNCQYINESTYDPDMVEHFQCTDPNYPVDDFAQCDGGSCGRIF